MRNKKQAFFLVAVFLGFSALYGQNQFAAPESRIALGTAILSTDPMPISAEGLLRDQLSGVLAGKGLSVEAGYGRFCVVASLTALSKDVLPGPPTQVAEKFNVTIYVVDNLEHTVFGSTSLTIRGVGTTEEKCFVNALQNLGVRNNSLGKVIEQSKEKIISYYETQSANIIATARSLGMRHQYEEAFYLLASIPMECPNAYSAALEAGNEVFKHAIDYWCQVNFAKAKMAWAADQNANGAERAGSFLATIYPEAACYDEAQDLYKEIKGKVLEDWRFEMKQYQDGVDLERERIKAWKEVGVAYGNHQPTRDYQINWLVR